jgi:hypothetical protein
MKNPWIWLVAFIFAPILLFPWDGNTFELPGDAYANEIARYNTLAVVAISTQE